MSQAMLGLPDVAGDCRTLHECSSVVSEKQLSHLSGF